MCCGSIPREKQLPAKRRKRTWSFGGSNNRYRQSVCRDGWPDRIAKGKSNICWSNAKTENEKEYILASRRLSSGRIHPWMKLQCEAPFLPSMKIALNKETWPQIRHEKSHDLSFPFPPWLLSRKQRKRALRWTLTRQTTPQRCPHFRTCDSPGSHMETRGLALGEGRGGRDTTLSWEMKSKRGRYEVP